MAAAQSKLRTVLERIASELKDEEARDELAELREELRAGHKLTLADLRDLISEAPPEDRAELRALLGEVEDDDTPTPRKPKKDPPTPPPVDDPPKPDPDRRVRPGRKSQHAYDWTVDEDTGEIVKAPMAYIYTGDDEPEEVELMPLATREAEGDDTGGDVE